MHILAVGRGLPAHYYDQTTLTAAMAQLWGGSAPGAERIATLQQNARVAGRHLALPLEGYAGVTSFTEANHAYRRCAEDLGSRALQEALAAAGLAPGAIDHLVFVSSTGVATPSIDAAIVNRLGLRPDVKRVPIFGLGCVAGAAGLARAADYLRGFPDQVAAVVAVELCSLTLQRGDASMANFIAGGLFGDGAAAALLAGAGRDGSGPDVVASRSVFYPDTQDAMGWDVGSHGFRLVLSPQVPEIVASRIGEDVDGFLAGCGLGRDDIARYICHPGGPKVLIALARALELPQERLALAWDNLERLGNVSSVSVLLALQDTLADPPPPGSYGLLMAMGPGFCSELLLLRW